MKLATKKLKKRNRFNSLPINPPKGKEKPSKLPNRNFRMIPQ
jgi:hypothetical protein